MLSDETNTQSKATILFVPFAIVVSWERYCHETSCLRVMMSSTPSSAPSRRWRSMWSHNFENPEWLRISQLK